MSRPLSNYCTLKGGTGFPESLQGNQEGDVAFIKVSDMSLPGNQRTITVANNYVDRVVAEQLNASAFPPRSTVFAKVGAALLLNRRRMLIEPTIIDNNMMAAVPTIADPEFLYHFLCSVDFANYVQMGALPSINQSTIGQIPFPEFSLSQQCRIAEILSTVDEAIEQTEALIAKYQQIKAGLMHDLFTRGLTPDGHLRPTRAQAPHLYKESPLGWIPKEWKVMPLDEHVRIIDCKHYTPAFQTEGFPFIRPRNVKVDGLDLQGVDYVSAEDFKTLTDVYQPRYGDIVFSRNASFGVPCYIDTDLQFAIGQDCVIMTAKASDARFVFCALTNSITTAQIAKVSAGSTFGRINLGEIRKLLIHHPEKEEEQRIAARFFACVDLSRKLIDELAKLRQQKQGLMHDLLTGRVRVKVGEPAST